MADETENLSDETNQDAPLADDAADTTLAEQSDDTLAADAAADTVVADAGADEVVDEPIVAAPVTQRADATVEPDDIDREFDAAIEEIEKDDILSPGQKRAEVVKLKAQREDRNTRRVSQVQDREDRARNAFAAEFGVTRQVLDSTWKDACDEALKTLGATEHNAETVGAAKLLLRQKITASKKPAAPKKKPLPNVPTTSTGARLSPPGGAASGRAEKPVLSAKEAFIKGNWSYPNPTMQ